MSVHPTQHVMCHVSHVTCNVSHVIFFYKVVKLIGGGSVIIGAYLVYFTDYEVDIVEVIFNLYVQGSKFGGKSINLAGKLLKS